MKKILLLLTVLLAAVVTPAEGQVWWGYYGGNEQKTSLGTGAAETFDCAIYVPANHNIAGPGTIKAIRFYLNTASNVSMAKVWISKELPSAVDNADYVQNVDVSTLKDGANDIELTTPFSINNAAIYIGYSFTIKSAEYCIVTGGDYVDNSLFVRSSKTVTTWGALTEYGKLGLQILLEGITLKDNSAYPSNFGTTCVVKGQSVMVPVKITNMGSQPVTSISYTITTSGNTSAEETLSTASIAFNQSEEVSIPFPADDETKKYEKTLTITKVNGQDNESAQKTASGYLFTILERTTMVPVVEEFTGTWCGWCPVGFDGMEKTHEKYGDKVALIAVHSGDEMETMDYIAVSGMASGYPSSFINRVYDCYPSADYLQRNLDWVLKNEVPVAEIQATAYWTSDDKTAINIETKTKFVYTDDNGQYGIAYVLVEDGMSNPNWTQANYLSYQPGYESFTFWYNSPSQVSGLEFNHVAVAAWFIGKGVSNSVNPKITAGEVQDYQYEANISANRLIQDKLKLKVIAMLIDQKTGAIVNAAQTYIADSSASGIQNISSSDSGEMVRYNLDGRQITTPQSGLNIIRMNDGSVKKVIVK